MEPEAESLVELLDELHGYAEPPPVSMMPATWGWAVLAAIVLGALVLGLWAFVRHRRATAWRRAALAELDALAPGLEAGEPAALARLEMLLRRVALRAFPRTEAAPLEGEGWAAFLARTGGGFGALGPALAEAPYRSVAGYDGAAALREARRWIGARHA